MKIMSCFSSVLIRGIRRTLLHLSRWDDTKRWKIWDVEDIKHEEDGTDILKIHDIDLNDKATEVNIYEESWQGFDRKT